MAMKTFGRIKLSALTMGLMLFVAMGCAGMQPSVTASQMAADPPPKEMLVPGDVIDVKFYYTPELNVEQTVQPDYTIFLQILGKVSVKGKTPEEVRDELVRIYASQLKKPEILVLVRTKSDRKVNVGGEVNRPGSLEWSGELTALEAIKRVGGFKIPEGDPRNVLVIRQKDGKFYGCVLDLEKVMTGQEDQAFNLQPRDVVYVPPTAVTKANNWVDQYVSRMIPRPGGVAFGLSYPMSQP